MTVAEAIPCPVQRVTSPPPSPKRFFRCLISEIAFTIADIADIIADMKPKLDLSLLAQEGEGYLVEFKESPSNLEKDICAFANANGGTIYIGISDKGEIKPINASNKLKAQLAAAVRTCDPAPDFEIKTVGKIIVLKINESLNKPVRTTHGFYLRAGGTSQKLTRDEILSFAVSETKILFDNQLFVKQTADERLDIRQIENFRRKARLDIDLDNRQLIKNLGCLKFQNNQPYLTNAGLLLFGKNPQADFPHATLTLLHMEDAAEILEQKIFSGSLFEQIEKSFLFLKSCLRTRPVIEGLRRENLSEFSDFVLRELLVNAIIHRDYFERSADIVVKIFNDYIEFSNPGTIGNRLPLNAIFGKSFRRNPMIADIFFHANYIERAGTGLLRVKKELEKLSLPPLKIIEEGPFFIITLFRKTAPALLDNELNERQRKILSFEAAFFPFSTLSYAAKFRISERSARLDIQDMVKKGLLLPIRNKQKIRYKKQATNQI